MNTRMQPFSNAHCSSVILEIIFINEPNNWSEDINQRTRIHSISGRQSKHMHSWPSKQRPQPHTYMRSLGSCYSCRTDRRLKMQFDILFLLRNTFSKYNSWNAKWQTNKRHFSVHGINFRRQMRSSVIFMTSLQTWTHKMETNKYENEIYRYAIVCRAFIRLCPSTVHKHTYEWNRYPLQQHLNYVHNYIWYDFVNWRGFRTGTNNGALRIVSAEVTHVIPGLISIFVLFRFRVPSGSIVRAKIWKWNWYLIHLGWVFEFRSAVSCVSQEAKTKCGIIITINGETIIVPSSTTDDNFFLFIFVQ